MFEPHRIAKMLRKPFRRKSAPTSPVAPPRAHKSRRESASHSEGGEPVGVFVQNVQVHDLTSSLASSTSFSLLLISTSCIP